MNIINKVSIRRSDYITRKRKISDIMLGIILLNFIPIVLSVMAYGTIEFLANAILSSDELRLAISNDNILIMSVSTIFIEAFILHILFQNKKNSEVKYLIVGNIVGVIIGLTFPIVLATIYDSGLYLFLGFFVTPMIFKKTIVDIIMFVNYKNKKREAS